MPRRTELQTIEDLQNHAGFDNQVYVIETAQIYYYNPTSTETADGVNVVSLGDSPGRWLTLSSPSTSQQAAQADYDWQGDHAFEQSPAVPAPTAPLSAANKAWVESTVQAAIDASGRANVIYVDPVNGVDQAGNGTASSPYKTITYGYNRVSTPASSVAGLQQWAAEKLIFALMPGEYNEGGTQASPNDVTLGFKRARIALIGDGVRIGGGINATMRTADLPYGDALRVGSGGVHAPDLPWPWTNSFVFPLLELQGVSGGMEAGFVTENIMVQGAVKMLYDTVTGDNWQIRLANNGFMADRVQLFGGMQVEGPGAPPAVTVELNDMSCQGGTLGRNVASSFAFSLKAHNSQLKSVVGPFASVLEIDNCRIQGGFDRTAGIGGGTIDFSSSSAYSKISDAAINATLFKVGSGSGNVNIYVDAISGAQLLGKSLDNGTGSVTLVFIDEAKAMTYQPSTPPDWLTLPATIREALDRIASAVAGLLAGPIP